MPRLNIGALMSVLPAKDLRQRDHFLGTDGSLSAASWFSARRLRKSPGSYQVVLEGAVSAMEDAIESVLPGRSELVFPFIATLWIFILAPT